MVASENELYALVMILFPILGKGQHGHLEK